MLCIRFKILKAQIPAAELGDFATTTDVVVSNRFSAVYQRGACYSMRTSAANIGEGGARASDCKRASSRGRGKRGVVHCDTCT